MWEMVPHLPTVGVTHPLNVEGRAHVNVGIMRGGGQDVVHTLRGGNNFSHDMQQIAVFPTLLLVVFTVVNNGVG